MHIEIHTPELEQRMQRRIQSGRYNDAGELLAKALDALDKTAPLAPSEEFSEPSVDFRTGADLIAALQSSPHRELEIEPPCYREQIVVRDVVL